MIRELFAGPWRLPKPDARSKAAAQQWRPEPLDKLYTGFRPIHYVTSLEETHSQLVYAINQLEKRVRDLETQ